MRGVVVTDSKGKELEVINSSLDSEDLAILTLNIVKQASETITDLNKYNRMVEKMNTGSEKALKNISVNGDKVRVHKV